MNRSTPGLPVHHQLPEFTQTQLHRVGDAILQSHPPSSPSPPAPNPSQHQSLFQWVTNIRHPSNITCCWTHALTLDISSDSNCGLAHALTLATLQDSWRLGITGCWAHALPLHTASDSTCSLAQALALDTLQDSWRLAVTGGWAHALTLDTLQGWKAFKESFQGGTHFSRREEPYYRKQRALECKKNACPGVQALQSDLMWLKIKANRLRKEKCTWFFFNLFHIILFIPWDK